MSKTTIEVEVIQCDHVDERGERCTIEGNRDVIKNCHVCHIDLCKTHCQITTVVFLQAGGDVSSLFHGHRLRFLYYFCSEHSALFESTVIERYGEGLNLPNVGDGTYLI